MLDRAAADAGVSVTRKQLQDARAAMAQQAGGEQAFAGMLLQQRGVAPGQIDDAVREQVQLTALAAATGADLSTPQGQAAVTKTLTEASKKLKIDVNPRYGTWDDKAIQLADAKTPWIAQVTKNGPEQDAPVTG